MAISKSDLNGIYLVVDPAMDSSILLQKVYEALEGGVGILQIWNHWPDGMQEPDKQQLVSYLIEMAADYEVPVFINEEWELLKSTSLDGVHFDAVPDYFERIKKEVGRDFITGITCNNDLDIVKWANDNDMDYVSFCAMFPSPTVESCEIVDPETVQEARALTDLPLFLSGGITPDKIDNELTELDFNGVAVISGILNADAPGKQTMAYSKAIENHKKRRNN